MDSWEFICCFRLRVRWKTGKHLDQLRWFSLLLLPPLFSFSLSLSFTHHVSYIDCSTIRV